MKKRSLSYMILLIVVVICLFGGVTLLSKDSTISINNNTDKTISGLKIKYSNSTENDIEIPEIQQKQTYKTKLILPENFTEGFIKICYVDKQGTNKEEYIEGYIEKGYKNKIIINIDTVDNNGVLSINIDK
jgi:hypothetical protein